MTHHDTIAELRRHILLGLGLATPTLLACGDRRVGPQDEGIVVDDEADDQQASEDAESSSSGAGGTTFTTTTTLTNSTTATDETMPEDCMVDFFSLGAVEPYQDTCMLPLTGAFDCPNAFYMACTAAVGDQSCAEQCPVGVCFECGDAWVIPMSIGTCGPYEIEGQCCALVAIPDDCTSNSTEGRPFVVEALARVAALLPPRVRASAWRPIAQAEHASVASFAQLVMQLVVHAAPPGLIADALAAAADEVRHAELARVLASRDEQCELEFGRLDVRGAGRALGLRELVRACVHEGCIGETSSALELEVHATGCSDPELAACLRRVAADETRHARLAWQIVAWALARAPDLSDELAPLVRPASHDVAPHRRALLDACLRPCALALLRACA